MHHMTLAEIARGLADKKFSSEELTKTLLARIAQLDRDIERESALNRDAGEVIERLDLFSNTPQLSEAEKLTALRSSTRIESISAPGVSVDSRMSLAAIVITSRAETAVTAAAIANDFADSVVNRDRDNRRLRIGESRDFLTAEERRLNDQLAAQEREIIDFSSRNEDSLPTAQEFLQTELARQDEPDEP